MTMTSNQPYLLRAIHEWILDNELTPHILVNADYDQVDVPEQFVQDGQIVLNIAPHAISGILMDNEAVSFTARFSGVAKTIYIPISAIKAIYASENGQGMVFPDVEVERAEHHEMDTETDVLSDEEQQGEKSLVSESTDVAETKISTDKKKETKKPPFLKVIK